MLSLGRRRLHTTSSARFLKKILRQKVSPPPIARTQPATSTWHGELVRSDEYSWMQQPEQSDKVGEYLRAEKQYTNQVMAGTERLQAKLVREMSKATEVEAMPPSVENRNGEFIYFVEGTGDGSLVYCRRRVDSDRKQVLMDSARLLRRKGLVIRLLHVSGNNTWMGCLVADANDDSGRETGTLLLYQLCADGRIEQCDQISDVYNFVFGSGGAVFYTVLNHKLRANKVMGHSIGDKQSVNITIYEEHDTECFLDITCTKDKEFFIVNSSTLDSSELHVFSSKFDFWTADKEQRKNALKLVRPRQKGVEYFVDHQGSDFLILTNSPADDTQRSDIAEPLPFRLVRAPTQTPSSGSWEEVMIVQDNERIEDLEVFKDYFMVNIKRRGLPAVLIFDRKMGKRSELKLPYNGNCAVRPDANPQLDTSFVRLSISSPVHLDSVVEYDMTTLRPFQSWLSTPLHLNPREFVVKRVDVPMAGVCVPMTLVFHQSVSLAQSPPMLVRVYGAYGVSLEPEFRIEDIPLLRRGWVIALAHVRGGGELGRPWYVDGRRSSKMNSVNDFIGCARYLLDKGWSATDRLCITGTSAGGLVVGSALNTHPEYFRAAALHVPFVDPLSAMLSPDLPLTEVERAEWGDPLASKPEYANIRSYAPYDNIARMIGGSEKLAPSILVTAGQLDQRVSVWQPAKWVARLRSTGGYSAAPPPQTNKAALWPKLIFDARTDLGHFHSHSDDGDHGFIKAHAFRNAFLLTEVRGWNETK